MGKSSLSADEFWAIKQETDDIVKRLGWSKEYCRGYCQTYFGKSSRLAMTDEQLYELRDILRNLDPGKHVQNPGATFTRRKRRKRR